MSAWRLTAFASAGTLQIRGFTPELASYFYRINAEWINSMLKLEEADQKVLEDPSGQIVEPGDAILFVEAPTLGIVGTCALQKTGTTSFELTKMGVRSDVRGLKPGEFLLRAAIKHARQLEADPL